MRNARFGHGDFLRRDISVLLVGLPSRYSYAATNLDSTLYGIILTAVSVPVFLLLKRMRQLGGGSS